MGLYLRNKGLVRLSFSVFVIFAISAGLILGGGTAGCRDIGIIIDTFGEEENDNEENDNQDNSGTEIQAQTAASATLNLTLVALDAAENLSALRLNEGSSSQLAIQSTATPVDSCEEITITLPSGITPGTATINGSSGGSCSITVYQDESSRTITITCTDYDNGEGAVIDGTILLVSTESTDQIGSSDLEITFSDGSSCLVTLNATATRQCSSGTTTITASVCTSVCGVGFSVETSAASVSSDGECGGVVVEEEEVVVEEEEEGDISPVCNNAIDCEEKYHGSCNPTPQGQDPADGDSWSYSDFTTGYGYSTGTFACLSQHAGQSDLNAACILYATLIAEVNAGDSCQIMGGGGGGGGAAGSCGDLPGGCENYCDESSSWAQEFSGNCSWDGQDPQPDTTFSYFHIAYIACSQSWPGDAYACILNNAVGNGEGCIGLTEIMSLLGDCGMGGGGNGGGGTSFNYNSENLVDINAEGFSTFLQKAFELTDTDGYEGLYEHAAICAGGDAQFLKGHPHTMLEQQLRGDIPVCQKVYDLYAGNDAPDDNLQLYIFYQDETVYIAPNLPNYRDGSLPIFNYIWDTSSYSVDSAELQTEDWSGASVSYTQNTQMRINTEDNVAASDGYKGVSASLTVSRVKTEDTEESGDPYHSVIIIKLIKALDNGGNEVGEYCGTYDGQNSPYHMIWVVNGDCEY